MSAELISEYQALSALHPPGDSARRELAHRIAAASGQPLHWMQAAFEAFSDHHFELGHAALRQVLDRAPDFLPARWLGFQFPRHVAPACEADIAGFRHSWSAGLQYFEGLDLRAPEIRSQVWGCIGSATPFYLHYLGDCLPEMRRHGLLSARMMDTLVRLPAPAPPRRSRPRVLFCSGYFRDHTVARLYLPLIEALDSGKLDIHVLDLDPRPGDWGERLQRCATVHAGPREAIDWVRVVRQLAPDSLVYLDIGMHPLSHALAALRLAPVQAMLWGHPVSSGLPTLDYVLSPDAIEPVDADSHYSETLVRLPGFGHGLDPASDPSYAMPAANIRRSDSQLEILCAQSVFKLLPAQDTLFARILAELPGSRLHLTAHHRPHVQDWLRERMRPAFESHGVDIDQRVVMHALLPLNGFKALARACDFGLDTLGWSGGMSALDLLPMGLPVVAVAGALMRERQTACMLRAAGVPELVAADADEYVNCAVELGRDPELRAALAHRLRSGCSHLRQPREVAAALEDFLT